MSDNSIKPYIITGTTIGALGGVAHGVTHLPEKSMNIIENMVPSVHDSMKNYRASFNMSKAQDAFLKGAISREEFDVVDNLTKVLEETAKKEKQVLKIQKTPFSQRTKSFKDAVKEANAMRPQLYKSLLKLRNNFQLKLVDLGIFDIQRFKETTNAGKKKAIAIFKEFSKSAAKGLGVGAAIGATIGAITYKIFSPKTKA